MVEGGVGVVRELGREGRWKEGVEVGLFLFEEGRGEFRQLGWQLGLGRGGEEAGLFSFDFL